LSSGLQGVQRTEFAIPVMVFIDGGYLRKWLSDECEIDIKKFDINAYIVDKVQEIAYGPRIYLIVRTYFYDGIAEHTEKEYNEQLTYHKYIQNKYANFEVRQGKLVRKSQGGFRQKGVDTLLAIDMIDKANSNQFDVAIVLAGDLDHLEAIRTVKNKGKEVFGLLDAKTSAEDLRHAFDVKFPLKKDEMSKYVV